MYFQGMVLKIMQCGFELLLVICTHALQTNNVCHLKFINNIITSFKHHIVYHAVGESIKALGIAVLIKLIFLTSLSVHFHLNSADKMMLRQLRADGVLLTYSAINWQT